LDKLKESKKEIKLKKNSGGQETRNALDVATVLSKNQVWPHVTSASASRTKGTAA
jgi:hypothetical protein